MTDSSLPRKSSWKQRWPAAAAIVVAGLFVYQNSFPGVFVFDDVIRIEQNPAIRQVWPPWAWLTYDRRPVAYLTFAANFTLHGLDVWGYHAVNLAIHIAAAWTLMGIVRRTLSRGGPAERYGESAQGIALAVALIWLVHPLQTQSVTYVVQRIESLMGLFFLLTLYGFIRAQDSRRPAVWLSVSVGCQMLGIVTKEVAAMAPLVVLWYDRVFLAASWKDLWKHRRAYYAALAASWGLLAFLMVTHWKTYGGRAGVVEGLTPWSYLLSQSGVLLHYLRLSFWPVGQCVDYGWPVAESWGEFAPPGLAILALLGLTVWCMFRRPEWGFLGGWFFLILAPTSSIVPIYDLAFEHRMYLPLAAVVTAGVLAVGALRRRASGTNQRSPAARACTFAALVLVVLALGRATILRNQVYHSGTALWGDVVQKVPGNTRGHYNYGVHLLRAARTDEAIAEFQQCLEIDDQVAGAHVGWGQALRELGKLNEAVQHFQTALIIDPENREGLLQLGLALRRQGKIDEAIRHYEKLLELEPGFAPAYVNWGVALQEEGKWDEAAEQFQTALRVDPGEAAAHFNLGNVRHLQGRLNEAVEHYERALFIDPEYVKAHYNLGNVSRELGNADAAIVHYRTTLGIEPRHAGAHNNWGAILHGQGRFAEAIPHYEQAIEIEPSNQPARQSLASAHVNLGSRLLSDGRTAEAGDQFRRALFWVPGFAHAHLRLGRMQAGLERWAEAADNLQAAAQSFSNDAGVHVELGTALVQIGRRDDAIRAFRRALEIDPGNAAAHESLRRLE